MYSLAVQFEMTQAIGSGEAVYKAFDWQKLGPKGTLIDVGGGVGAAAYALSTYLPGWKVVVQDRAEVVKDGQEASHLFCLLALCSPLIYKSKQKTKLDAELEYIEISTNRLIDQPGI
jgi:hypothetical protein